ncbi:MAG TPA: stage II sporulation protein M [Myxococcaceae bacterium]|nr:stage II sporulation protein M [Myxococcaceae bacterium]
MPEPLHAFVARCKPDWEQLQQLLRKQRERTLPLAQLRTLDTLYRRAAADLAYAQSFCAGTDVHRYLNQLCGSAYAIIYRPPAERLVAIKNFFTSEFPSTLRAERRYVGASAAVFLVGLLLGAMVVTLEPRGAELLVPAAIRRYVAEKRMWTNDLLSIAPPNLVASAIATNNLTVTIFAFASGILGGLGTLFTLVNNGVQIGAIFALCIREGMALPLLGFVGAHGPVELSVIVISGAAGLMVGRSVIDPGELPRLQCLKQRGIQAVKLVLGCAPFLALTGVVEGFVSPGDLFRPAVKIALGLGLGAAFWLYLFLGGRADEAGPPEEADSTRSPSQ